MLQVVTPASNFNLIELATVKAFLGIAGPDTSQDVQLQKQIEWASSAIAVYCKRQIALQDYSETLSGLGSPILRLGDGRGDGAPLVASSVVVTVEGVAVTDFVVEDADAGFLRRTSGPGDLAGFGTWRWSARTGGRLEDRPVSGTERGEIVAAWTGGFLLPGDAAVTGAKQLPAVVERACWDTISDWLGLDSRDTSITSRTVIASAAGQGAVTISYGPPPASGLPRRVKDALTPFVR